MRIFLKIPKAADLSGNSCLANRGQRDLNERVPKGVANVAGRLAYQTKPDIHRPTDAPDGWDRSRQSVSFRSGLGTIIS